MDDKPAPDELVEKILQLIEAAVINVDYTNCIYWIFGISSKDTPNQASLFRYLLEQREEYRQLYSQIRNAQREDRFFQLLNIEDKVTMFEQLLAASSDSRKVWKENSGPVEILCSESELRDLASQAKEKGRVMLTKSDMEKYFNFSKGINFWKIIPNYTTFFIGGGVGLSSPEFDLFEAMCMFYNQAVLTNNEIPGLKQPIEKQEADMDVYNDVLGRHLIMCRQTVINAFLLVEAFINSIAELSLADPSRNFTDEQKRYLKERAKDKDGRERQKFVPIEIKLFDWTKMISPTGKTFNKGGYPFQDFMRLKEYRDALVHLSAPKIRNYYLIDFKIAQKAVKLALEMVKKISECIAPDSANVVYPFWLAEPQNDGIFHISHTLKF